MKLHNDQQVEITLSDDWKKVKIQHERQMARLQLEQIKNTAGFNDNMDAMYEFYKLLGYSVTYPTCTRTRCSGSEAK
jgi:hypothetical protein